MATTTINQSKLAEIQSKIKVNKGQYNSFGKYHYRSAEDIIEAVKPIINSMGFHLLLSDQVEAIGDRYYIKSTATLTNGIETFSTSAYAREEESKKGMDASQISGSTSSYSRKYALNGLFALDDNKDSDATNTHGKSKVSVSDQDIKDYKYLLDQIVDISSLREVWEDLPEEWKSDANILKMTNEKKKEINNIK